MKNVKNFLTRLESLIEKDRSHIFLSGINTYDIVIMRYGSDFFKDYIKLTGDKHPKNPKYEFYYENKYVNLLNFIEYQLYINKGIGITYKVPLFDKYIKENKNLFKVYGFYLEPSKKDFTIHQLSANELLESFSVDYITGETIPPPTEYIYCGENIDDIICGFDLD